MKCQALARENVPRELAKELKNVKHKIKWFYITTTPHPAFPKHPYPTRIATIKYAVTEYFIKLFIDPLYPPTAKKNEGVLS